MHEKALSQYRQRFEQVYPHFLPTNMSHIGKVYDAVHYSFEAGGKRLRPALIYALAESLDISLEKVDSAAVAIECLHTYSLIHDDLPDMDDDDLRRGKLSCHKQFNAATAILAGDALNTLAFEILAGDTQLNVEKKIKQIAILASSAGINGMIAGQDTDLTCEYQQQPIALAVLSELHEKKTAKLIEAALLMTYAAGDTAYDVEKAALLSNAARSLGLFYQIQDDILDVTQSSEMLGKPAGSDLAQGKSTYVSLLGLDEAQVRAHTLIETVNNQLTLFFAPQLAYEKTPLAELVTLITQRDH